MLSVGVDVPACSEGPALDYYERFVAGARAAGFSHLWVGDHLLWRRPRLEALALLAALAALPGVRGMTLGTGIALAPLRNPIWLAKSAATLDWLTEGRFILGVGVGGENAAEFAAAGTRVDRRGAVTNRAIDAMRAAWAGQMDGFSPVPTTNAIPIWVGGRGEASIKRAAERGDGWLPLFLTAERFAVMRELLEARRRAAQRRGPFTHAMTVWSAVDDDSARARDVALDTAAREYALERERFSRYVAAGTPGEVTAQLAAFVDAGAEHLAIHLAHPEPASQLPAFAQVIRSLTG